MKEEREQVEQEGCLWRSSRHHLRQVTASKGGHGRPSTLQSEAGADRYASVLAAPLPWRAVAGIDLADALKRRPDSHCSSSASREPRYHNC